MRNAQLRTSRITYRATAIAAMAALLIAVSAAPSLARYHDSNAASVTTTSVTPNGTVETTVTTATAGPDYTVLADPDLDYFQIQRARSYGMTDDQIAQAAKLAHYSYESMGVILNRIEDGCTIPDLAMEYGVPLNDVLEASDWRDHINDYTTAYDCTGWGELRHGPIHENVASYTSTTGSVPMVGTSSTTTMNSTTTVTPSTDNGMSGSTTTTTTTTAPSDTSVAPPQSTTTTTTTNGTDSGPSSSSTTTTTTPGQ